MMRISVVERRSQFYNDMLLALYYLPLHAASTPLNVRRRARLTGSENIPSSYCPNESSAIDVL